jgi:CheY-like chemotaxis protein
VVLIGIPVLLVATFARAPKEQTNLLLLSTDDSTRKLIAQTSKRLGINVNAVYRYEDGIARLNITPPINVIVIDDSIPQVEIGLLIRELERSTLTVVPVIQIVNADEIGLTVGVAGIEVGVGNIFPELSLPQPDIIKIASKKIVAKIK